MKMNTVMGGPGAARAGHAEDPGPQPARAARPLLGESWAG